MPSHNPLSPARRAALSAFLPCACGLAAFLGAAAVAQADRADYETLVEFGASGAYFSVHADDFFSVTHIYVEDYPRNGVTRHTIDAGLNRTETLLPIAYGLPWIAADLDGDGHIELVLQRGDPGMGGDGYLDIHSAPDWALRARITLPGMKLVFFPVAIDVDDDSDLEIFLAPGSLSGTARAMLVDYDRPADLFVVRADIAAPAGTYGHTAAGDFDGDGRVEFITGNNTGYGLFEFDPAVGAGGLFYRGQVGDPYPGSHAIALRPLPCGTLHALLGHSSFTHGYRYQLLRPTGDNTFAVAHVFHEYHGYAGHQPSYGLDADGDGLDEIVMEFHPYARIYEWDPGSQQFQVAWSWDQTSEVGTLVAWADTDLDRDGVREWCSADHLNVIRAFEDQDAAAGLVCLDPRAGGSGPGRLQLLPAPNPASGPVRIAWHGGPGGVSPAALDLYDAEGRLQRRWRAPAGGWPAPGIEWDGRGARGEPLPAGAYWLEARSGALNERVRLVRLR
ncbi:MAG: hypothetical protein FJY75_07480 [Candidatus Eisenbacteria bacterium]|uniref:VCBS repeat-containing protein n=1 Tax=Eiseniibacteriota bacterium TaxID=2212470 RepID=A0A937X866_UNCEI|nr:hypothetical protein [Candidatus Eisenbacteria bacterium]